MKDLKVPVAILITALLNVSAIIFNSYSYPLKKFVDRLLKLSQIKVSKKINK
tara:strand:- start:128 stop:283 length:156 start_codon:yes stop_codon:yes gene_type:complete